MNKSDLHHALKRVAWSNKALELIKHLECGWNDGACWLMAEAIHRWLGPKSKIVVIESYGCKYRPLPDSGPIDDHVLVQVGDFFLDSDGIVSKRTLLKRWRETEMRLDPRVVATTPSPEIYGCPKEERQTIRKIVQLLESEVGDGPAIAKFLAGV